MQCSVAKIWNIKLVFSRCSLRFESLYTIIRRFAPLVAAQDDKFGEIKRIKLTVFYAADSTAAVCWLDKDDAYVQLSSGEWLVANVQKKSRPLARRATGYRLL